MAVVKSSNFQIDIQCPQCGAPIVIQETVHIIECPFCRVRSILSVEPFPCYYFEPHQEKLSNMSLVYIPYWRFKGLEFALAKHHVSYRVIDNSWKAVKNLNIPASLGLRSQTQKLKFIQPGTKGIFLPHEISRKEIVRHMDNDYDIANIISGTSSKQTKKKQVYVHIGEIISLIYLPFYKTKSEIFDGFTGNKINFSPGLEKQIFSKGQLPEYNYSFQSGLCPNCGWDLTGASDSLVLVCKGCLRAYRISRTGLKPFKVQCGSIDADTDILIPFWKLAVKFTKLQLKKYADIIKLANLPKAILNEHKTKDFYFFIPGFKINPKLFLRLGKQVSLLQPDSIPFKTQLPRLDFYPGDLPLQEGLEAVLPILMELCKRQKGFWEILVKEKIKLDKYSLIYLPFTKTGSEYVQPELKFSIPVNSLKFGRTL